MVQHKESKYSTYSPKQLFNLVLDIEKYPEFLPWCSAARILRQEGNISFGELVIGFKSYADRYTSKIEQIIDGERYIIKVEQVDGPFKYLNNLWQFEYDKLGKQTKIDFTIDFSFKSPIIQKLVGLVFERALLAMMNAFEQRAQEIYGQIR